MLDTIKKNLIVKVDGYRTLIHVSVISTFVLLFGYLSLSEPSLNWDMVAYIANALQYNTDNSIAQIQQMIFTELAESVSNEDFATFTNSPSREVLATDPEAFGQTIKFFYDARVVYIGILAAFMRLGMDPIFASYFISTSCSILSILLLAKLVPVRVPLGLCFSLPFIVLACGLLNVARYSSPDAMAALVTIGMYWLLVRNHLVVLLLLMPLTVFVRTDLILLMPMFLTYLFLFKRISRIFIVFIGLATVATYLTLNNIIVDGDPWSSLIGYNYGIKPTHPADYVFTVTLSNYFSYIITGIKSFSYNPLFFMFCALTVTGLFLFASRFFFNPNQQPISRQHTDLTFLIISCITYVGLHFLLFPVTWIRFFAAQYSLVTVVVLWATLAILAERNYSDRTDVNLLDK